MELTNFGMFFLLCLACDCGLKIYLNYRQIQAVINKRDQVPAVFAAYISTTEHQKSANYSVAKLKLATIEALFITLFTAAMTFGGGINYLIDLLTTMLPRLSAQVATIIAYFLLLQLAVLPFSYYSTFKIEEKFGFNKVTPQLFITDLIKGLILGLVITTPLLYLIIYLMQILNTQWWFWVWLITMGFNLLLLLIYPLLIAPLFNKFTPLDDPELDKQIMLLLKRCGFKSNGVFIMDGSKRSSHGNAYFTGLGKAKRIVFFDTLLKQLTHKEILAILAHELGHFKHRHVLKQLGLSSLITFVGLFIFSFLLDQDWFYHGFKVDQINAATGLLLLFIFSNSISLILAPGLSFLSRKNEYEADNFAKTHAHKEDLISGLIKLYRDNSSTLTPDNLYVQFYYSHPPASLRIANLEN